MPRDEQQTREIVNSDVSSKHDPSPDCLAEENGTQVASTLTIIIVLVIFLQT
jgi:hypothetical protein